MSERLPWRVVFDNESGKSGHVYVGDTDISRSVTELHLEADAKGIVSLTLTVIPARLEVSGFAVDEAPIRIRPLDIPRRIGE